MQKSIIAQDKEHLRLIIKDEMKINGSRCSLNHIDVSRISNMVDLFVNQKEFNGDISEWDVSNVKSMNFLFFKTEFKGDISKWDISNLRGMHCMFYKSEFNGDISNWNVANVETMSAAFSESSFKKDLTNWKPLSLKLKIGIFKDCFAPIPYWAEAENTPFAVKTYWLNKELESSLINKSTNNKKIKI